MTTLAPQMTTVQAFLILCTVVGMAVVIGWLVRGALIILIVGAWALTEAGKAHRRGIARVRAYNAKLTEM